MIIKSYGGGSFGDSDYSILPYVVMFAWQSPVYSAYWDRSACAYL